MRHGVLLLLAAGLVACSEADPIRPPEEQTPEPRAARVDEMRVVKVRGDQEVQVPPPEIVTGSVRALRATVGEDGWTDEPLVARIEVVRPGGLQALQAGDSVYVPKGTLVHWHLSDGCGRLFAATTATDDSAVVVNRWAPGTKAGTCTATAGRLVGTEIVYDAEFELEVLPGPVVRLWYTQQEIKNVRAGDTIDYSIRISHGEDAYGNVVPKDEALSQVTFRWAITPLDDGGGCRERPSEPTGEGWLIPVPEEAAEWPRRGEWNACLWVWYLSTAGPVAILVY